MRGLSTLRSAWPACLLVAAASCGASSRSAAPSPAAASVEPWTAMSKEQRLEYMTSTVMPRMKALFVAYDPHRYARMTCATCHGADGRERGWAMPNGDLLLEPSPWNTTGAAPADAPSERDAFMARSVAPEMARLLGRPYGPSSQTGFGCFGCHTPER